MSKSKSAQNSQPSTPTLAELRVGSLYELSARKGTYFTTLDSEAEGYESTIRTALETADTSFDAVAGQSLYVGDIIAHKVKTWNQAGTVQDEKLRVVLQDAEGRLIAGLHDRLLNAAVEIFGLLQTADGDGPIRLRLEKIGQKRSFRGYRVVPESIT